VTAWLVEWDVERYSLEGQVRQPELGVHFVRAHDTSTQPPTPVMIKAMPRASLDLLARYSLVDLVGRDNARVLEGIVGTPGLPTEEALVARVGSSFQAEAVTVAGLQHPNVLRLLDRGEQRRWAYHVYEIGSRRTLESLIEEQRTVSPEVALVVAAQLAEVLSYLHARNLIHGFCHPANLLVESNYHLKVSGFAFGWEWVQSLVPAYTPPEWIFQERRLPAGDSYIFGGVVWKLFTGRPYVGVGSLELARFHIQPPDPDLSLAAPNCPRWLGRLVWRCLQPAPEKRPTAREILDELDGRVPPLGFPSIAEPASSLLSRQYPAPFGTLLRDLVRHRSPEIAWRRVLELGECVIKTGAIVGAALAGETLVLPDRPSLGSWMQALRRLTKGAQQDLLARDDLNTLDEVVTWRNASAHGAGGDPALFERLAREDAPRVLDLLRRGALFAHLDWSGGLRFRGRSISSPDLVRFESCTTCGRNEPFFFNGISNNRRQRYFLSYETGHTYAVACV
jgi:hypothetical protein